MVANQSLERRVERAEDDIVELRSVVADLAATARVNAALQARTEESVKQMSEAVRANSDATKANTDTINQIINRGWGIGKSVVMFGIILGFLISVAFGTLHVAIKLAMMVPPTWFTKQ